MRSPNVFNRTCLIARPSWCHPWVQSCPSATVVKPIINAASKMISAQAINPSSSTTPPNIRGCITIMRLIFVRETKGTSAPISSGVLMTRRAPSMILKTMSIVKTTPRDCQYCRNRWWFMMPLHHFLVDSSYPPFFSSITIRIIHQFLLSTNNDVWLVASSFVSMRPRTSSPVPGSDQ